MDIKQIIAAGGGATAIARELGIAHSSVLGWRVVPAERCMRVSQLTGIALHTLRPDVYPSPEAVPCTP
jgi:DNA-binding transcriptional regulator YdaS (Cro superfamily)